MAIRTYKVTLDSKNTIAPEPVFLRQGDKTGAVVIDATLMDNGSPVPLSGLTPMFKANTADGQAVIADSTGFNIVNESAGEFTYQVPNALSSVPGKITTAYFSLSDSSGSESTFDVAFVIKKAVDITQPQADDYIAIIDGTIQSLQQKIDAMNPDVQTVLNNFNQGYFYNKAQTDSKDAAALASAKAYADTQDATVLTDAKSYAKGLGSSNWDIGMHFIAHRGNNAEWPENSLPAFRHTGRFWGIETDTSVTSDGTWVIMHDNTVDRMTNGTGAIKDMTYAQIAALRLDAGTNVAGCRDDELVVPRVSDYLRICKEIGKVPILEIKPTITFTAANFDNLVSIIRRLGWESQMWIISFEFTNLQEMRKRIPNLHVQWLVGSYSDAAVDQVAALGANVAIDTGTIQNVTEANVAYAHNKGVLFNVWTGDDNTNAESLANIGVDFLTKNGLSGDRKCSVLTLQNGWEQNIVPFNTKTSVAQIGSGYVHLSLNMHGGTTTKGTTIAQLPDWATPYNTIWANCVIRTTSGVALGTIDIVGRSNDPRAYSLIAGLGWDQMNSSSGWVVAEITYYVGW